MDNESKIYLFITVTVLAIAAYLASQDTGASVCHFWQSCFWQKLLGGQIGGSTTASTSGSGNSSGAITIGSTLDELGMDDEEDD